MTTTAILTFAAVLLGIKILGGYLRERRREGERRSGVALGYRGPNRRRR